MSVATKPAHGGALRDPLRLCVYTTIGLIAWLVGPATVVLVFAAIGLGAYMRAWRGGLRRSDCVLRDPRLVMAYLGLAMLAGAAGTGLHLWQLVQSHI